ncbi:uncharacterized protein LOC142099243 isoform X2 [Mixophyes fleayi]|uniref:uncharacterized protein LOC142099243 isoform X2 n=1 Tax=Mixophyes fleayi TaxID=3061075 RepID=UPI003F4E3F9E
MVGSTAFLLLLIVCAAPGNAELGALDEFGTVGSSVLLRGVPIDRDTAYDLKKGNIIIVAYHGSAKVRGEYAQRGNFSSNNGTFLLWDLRREDSGIYEHWVNSTVRRKSNLRVIEKVNEPILSREDLQADNGRCLVKLLCTAWGEGPFNVSFLRDEKDVNQNITRKDNVTILVIDSWDPDSAGSYTCNSSNPVSWNMAETITVVLSTATHWKLIAAVVITVLSPRWCFFVVILIIKYIKREKDMEQADQHICKSRYTFQAIIQAEFLLGFLWELAAAVICLIGHFFPNPWKYIPVGLFSVLVLCRILCYQEKCTHSYIKCTSSFITQLSDVLFLPGFYVYILIISNSNMNSKSSLEPSQ